MGIEAATYIGDFVPTNPLSNDLRSQGDDQIRLIKQVLQNTFPGVEKAFYFPSAASVTTDTTILPSDMNKTFFCSTAAGQMLIALPTLSGADAGWTCYLWKYTADANPLLIFPPGGGVLYSGGIPNLTRARRCIPGVKISCIWSGAAWVVSRALPGLVGSLIEYSGATLPFGFEWPNGQTLSSAGAYPEYFATFGSGVTLDKRGRVGIPLDNLGGSSAGRLPGGVIAGTTLGAVGGTDTVALILGQLPSLVAVQTNLAVNVLSSFSDFLRGGTPDNFTSTAGSGQFDNLTKNQVVSSGLISISATVAGTGTGGGGTASGHSNLQPSIMDTQLLVVE